MRPRKRKCKTVSKEQDRARWRNFAKMRVAGAISLRDLCDHKYANTLSSNAKGEIASACQHLEWALERWEG